MKIRKQLLALVACLLAGLLCALSAPGLAQSLGSAGTVSGTVTDPNNAVIKGATVVLQNSVTGYRRTVTTDSSGAFRFTYVPPNNYQLIVTAGEFHTASQSITVRTLVPINLNIPLTVSGVSSTVEIASSENIIENIPTTHTDVDQSLIARLPVRSPGSGLSDVVTFAAPGVVADSNGLFHPLGDHAQASISFDNQPISDQSSKAFSTQPPLNAIQSMEVISGVPPAEYGDKTSLVINAITRSGIDDKPAHGSFSAQYGSFGTTGVDAAVGTGGKNWGNFLSASFTNTSRFLDPPELTHFHDRGNGESVLDRIDFNPRDTDTLHLNLS